MSKKKEAKKNLQKRLTALVEIYMEQKGKEKHQELKEFIEQKMDEIISFRDSLNKRKAAKQFATDVSPFTGIQPSPALVEELKNNHNNHSFQDASSSHQLS